MSRGIRFFVDPRVNSEDPEERMAYGLNVMTPWQDGGSLFINFPEHLEYMPGTKGIARHHDLRPNVWQVSEAGTKAEYFTESLTEPGVFFGVRGRATDDLADFEMTIVNRSAVFLQSVRPLLCHQYHGLHGFPAARTDNFAHTYVLIGGELICVDALPVARPEAYARMAQVANCPDEHNWWAQEMGGFIETQLDCAFTLLTDSEGKRKAIVAATPGKNLLTNSAIPCIHADPSFGDIAPCESRVAQTRVLFTEATLATVAAEFLT